LKRFVTKTILPSTWKVEQGNGRAYAQQEELRGNKDLFKFTYLVGKAFSK